MALLEIALFVALGVIFAEPIKTAGKRVAKFFEDGAKK